MAVTDAVRAALAAAESAQVAAQASLARARDAMDEARTDNAQAGRLIDALQLAVEALDVACATAESGQASDAGESFAAPQGESISCASGKSRTDPISDGRPGQ